MTAADIRVRPARDDAADLAATAALFDAYRQFYGKPADAGLCRTFIGERLRRGDSHLLLAESPAGAALGFCQLYPALCSVEAAPILTLYDLFVAPAARRHGVARSLLLAAEDLARREGVVRMDLSTARTNLAAQALYRGLGWTQDEVFLVFNRRIRD